MATTTVQRRYREDAEFREHKRARSREGGRLYDGLRRAGLDPKVIASLTARGASPETAVALWAALRPVPYSPELDGPAPGEREGRP